MNKRVILTIAAILSASVLTAQWQSAKGPYGGLVNSLYYHGDRLLAGGDGSGLWYSEDDGNNWSCSNGLKNGFVYTIASVGDTLFAGSTAKCHYSVDNGTTFTSYTNGLSGYIPFKALGSFGSKLYAATEQGLYKSTDRNADWVLLTEGLSMQRFMSLAVLADTIFAGSEDGLYISRDGGTTWAMSYTGLTDVAYWWYRAVMIRDSLVLTGHSAGISKSIDGGRTWNQLNIGLNRPMVEALYQDGERIYAGTYLDGVFVTDDDGETWQPVSQNIGNNAIHCFSSSQNALFAGTENGVNRLDHGSNQWLPVLNGFDGAYISALASAGNTLLAGNDGGALSVSNSGGDSWNSVSNGLRQTTIYTISIGNPDIYAGCWGGLFKSIDQCASWTEIPFNLPDQVRVYSFLQKEGVLYAGTLREGILVSTDNGGTWSPRNNGLAIDAIRALVSSGNRLFAASYNEGVFVSEDAGNNWVALNNALAEKRVYSLMVRGATLMAGTYQGFYYFDQTNNSWAQAQTGSVVPRVYGFAYDDSNLFAATSRGVYFSTDEGRNWAQNNTGLENINVENVAIAGNTLYTGTNGRGVWKCPIHYVLGTDARLNTTRVLKVYPNPTNGFVHISCPAMPGSRASLTLTDLTGRVILSEMFTGEKRLDTSGWNPGVYWVRITDEGGSKTVKLVVL